MAPFSYISSEGRASHKVWGFAFFISAMRAGADGIHHAQHMRAFDYFDIDDMDSVLGQQIAYALMAMPRQAPCRS
ncbi:MULTISPECIES: hypothetical protein [unclassified Paenibacillus]|uniref:hypothetical protein n=1 Tax=unclassified Paenibacillus TaxID=185978 RepID=UPI00093160E7|nr:MULTISPECIES: hypothetical protein [unclassified Paenibacillus]